MSINIAPRRAKSNMTFLLNKKPQILFDSSWGYFVICYSYNFYGFIIL